MTIKEWTEGARLAQEFLKDEGWDYDASSFWHCCNVDEFNHALLESRGLDPEVKKAFEIYLGRDAK